MRSSGRGERGYLYCERCGAVRVLGPDEIAPLKEQIEGAFGYQARFTHFPLVGVCPACAGPAERTRYPGSTTHSAGARRPTRPPRARRPLATPARSIAIESSRHARATGATRAVGPQPMAARSSSAAP